METVGDAVNYTGKITSPSNIVNKEYVDSKAGGVDIELRMLVGRSKGDMWYCLKRSSPLHQGELMANKAFPTIPGTINIPSGVEDFKTAIQVVWTASDWTKANSPININYGPAAGQIWESNENFEIKRQENIYQPQQGSGFMVYANAAAQRQTVFYTNGDSRWMPASVFNGIGFETYPSTYQWSPRS